MQVKVASGTCSFQSFSAHTAVHVLVHEHVNAVLIRGCINLIVIVHNACLQLTLMLFLYLSLLLSSLFTTNCLSLKMEKVYSVAETSVEK